MTTRSDLLKRGFTRYLGQEQHHNFNVDVLFAHGRYTITVSEAAVLDVDKSAFDSRAIVRSLQHLGGVCRDLEAADGGPIEVSGNPREASALIGGLITQEVLLPQVQTDWDTVGDEKDTYSLPRRRGSREYFLEQQQTTNRLTASSKHAVAARAAGVLVPAAAGAAVYVALDSMPAAAGAKVADVVSSSPELVAALLVAAPFVVALVVVLIYNYKTNSPEVTVSTAKKTKESATGDTYASDDDDDSTYTAHRGLFSRMTSAGGDEITVSEDAIESYAPIPASVV